MAGVTGTSTAYPGDTGVRPPSISTIGTMLQSWGYCTGYFGKNNEVPGQRGERQRPVRPLADAQRLRQVLRLHRRRAVQLLPQPDRRDDLHRDAARGGLPLQHRPDEQGDRLDPGDAVADAGPPVPHVLRPERESPAAHAAADWLEEGSSTRASSTRAGTSSARRSSRGRSSWASSRPDTKLAPEPRHGAEVGQPRRRREEGVRPADGGVRDPDRARRLRGRPPGRRASRNWASSTTRCSSTSSATTAARSSAT